MGQCFGCPCASRGSPKQSHNGRGHETKSSHIDSATNGSAGAGETNGGINRLSTQPSRAATETGMSCFSEGDEFHSCKGEFSVTDTTTFESIEFSPRTSPKHVTSPALGDRPSRADPCTHKAGTSTGPCSHGGCAESADVRGTMASPFAQDRMSAAAAHPMEEDEKHDTVEPLSRLGSKKKSSIPAVLSIIESISARLHHSSESETDSKLPPRHVPSRKHAAGSPNGAAGAPVFVPPVLSGASLRRRDMSMSVMEVALAYQDGEASHYNIRGVDYMKTKVKVNSEGSIYQLATADMFSFEKKQSHIAQLMRLPLAPPPTHMLGDSPSEGYLPPLLVINLQLPTYAPSLFGSHDGPGWSIVYYFTLPEDFDPAAHPNQKALGLLKRFIQNAKEKDGTPTRDRFKIIPRCVNVDEWAQKAPLSSAEYKLLSTYNEKPVLSRPQHQFFHGPNYLEVDFDIHCYSYLARTALTSFMSRLSSVVFELAFVIQGNSSDELPEQVLGAGRIFRADFATPRPFTSFQASTIKE